MHDQPAHATQPFEGLVVIDMGQLYAAPYATLLLALGGATVVKVEPPGGEALRRRSSVKNVGAEVPFYLLSSGKLGVAVNLKDPRGLDLLWRLVSKADVFVENFRPGVLDKYGLGAAAMRARHPRLIYASCSGYGKTGAYRDMLAMDLTIQAMSGVMSTTGFPENPPVKAGPAVADFFGGIHLFSAITSALYRREHTGEGATIDVALMECLVPSFLSNLGLLLGTSEPPPERTGNRHGGLSVTPYNVYPTSNGHIAILAQNDAQFACLAATIERPELATDPAYATANARVPSNDMLDKIIAEWTRTRSTTEAFDTLRAGGVPCAPVRGLRDVIDDPHLRERELVFDTDVPGVGNLPLMQSPIRFEGEPRSAPGATPGLGEHSRLVLSKLLGMTSEEIDQLAEAEVI